MENKEHLKPLETELRKYMLGELTELEQQRYEERLLTEDEMFGGVEELAEVVQDELVEDYLAGKLSKDQRRAFERCQLASSKVREMRLVQEALRARARREVHETTWTARLQRWVQPTPFPVQALGWGLILLVMGGVGWKVFETARTEPSPRLAQVGPPEKPAALVSFVLLPGLQRSSGGATRVAIPAGQNLLELKLDLGLDEYKSYQAALFNSSGDLIVEQQHLSAVRAGERVYVVIQLPRLGLREDDYQIALRGVDANGKVDMIDRYSFRLIFP